MKRKMIFLMLMLFILSVASMNAQVIIGGSGSEEPHAGAGLDLSPLGDKHLGLLIPNVTLGSSATDFVLVEESEVTEETEEIKTAATGMIVYNPDDVLFGAGLYVWTGSAWKKLIQEQ
jgi:hypothetical protein